jgi:hypothetical protein
MFSLFWAKEKTGLPLMFGLHATEQRLLWLYLGEANFINPLML